MLKHTIIYRLFEYIYKWFMEIITQQKCIILIILLHFQVEHLYIGFCASLKM